ncbi:MAG: LuxR family transcriptional regulator [Sphingomonadales bacterium]|nr:MAG: LuxR family transcriptional regulator [Sphingomonadales bacterium]
MSPGLSARQEECLRLTAFLTDKEIAARLGLSEATVKKHVHEACRRLGVNRRKAALALLERKVPEDTKDPIGAPAAAPSSALHVREDDNGFATTAPSPVDLGGSGSGSGRVQLAGRKRSGARASDAGAGGGRGAGEPARAAATGSERGMGDGPGGRAEPRLGYRPPPRNWGVRILIIVVTVVLAAVMMRAIADSVVAYQRQVRLIDETIMQGDTPPPTR